MKFLVVVPTIRRGRIGDTIKHIVDTFTHPTDFHLMDGNDGKSQTLNRVIKKHLDTNQHNFYVTIDDDFLPAKNWQDVIIEAFQFLPQAGALGLDLSNTEEGQRYMLNISEERSLRNLKYREARANLPGAFIAMPIYIATQVGECPILADCKYQFYEDGWRCMRVRQLGFKCYFVKSGTDTSTLLHYGDSPEYLASHDRDIQTCIPLLRTIGL